MPELRKIRVSEKRKKPSQIDWDGLNAYHVKTTEMPMTQVRKTENASPEKSTVRRKLPLSS